MLIFPSFPWRNRTPVISKRIQDQRKAFMSARGIPVKQEDVEMEMNRRDKQDSSRKIAPLRPAADARLIDSTKLKPEEVVENILQIIKRGKEAE